MGFKKTSAPTVLYSQIEIVPSRIDTKLCIASVWMMYCTESSNPILWKYRGYTQGWALALFFALLTLKRSSQHGSTKPQYRKAYQKIADQRKHDRQIKTTRIFASSDYYFACLIFTSKTVRGRSSPHPTPQTGWPSRGSGGRLNQRKPVQDIFVIGIKGSLNSAKARRALLKGPNGKIAYKSEYAPLVKNRQ